MLNSLSSFVPFIGTVIAVGVILFAAQRLFIGRHIDLEHEPKFRRQLIMLGLTLLGLLVILFALPISESSRNQLIGLVGVLLSGVLAFSSTTIISNLMAGVLLRVTKPFKVGDFVRIGDHFGRVSERGLFDTEIQTETRELIALPNTYCISNPVATILGSGTIVSATLSLGYDIDRKRIELLLIEAAQECGLQEPYVHIMELANFSVTYRVSGFLEETKRLISIRSSLYGCVLDTLHKHGIEIMSPTYMIQSQLPGGATVIPPTEFVRAPEENKASAEDIVFDKAEQAEEIENEKLQLLQDIETLEKALKEASDEEQKEAKQAVLKQKKEHLKLLEEMSPQTES